jgi:hypothetical protein
MKEVIMLTSSVVPFENGSWVSENYFRIIYGNGMTITFEEFYIKVWFVTLASSNNKYR